MAIEHPLRTWRREHRKTLADVAAAVSCAPSFLSDVERGNKQPSLPLSVKLSTFSGVPVEQFIKQTEAV